MAIDKALMDQLLADYKKPEDIIGENGLLKQLTKAILERALQAELTDHLGFEKHDPAGHHSGNSRNGSGRKVVKGDFGELELGAEFAVCVGRREFGENVPSSQFLD
jgi:putative transposase